MPITTEILIEDLTVDEQVLVSTFRAKKPPFNAPSAWDPRVFSAGKNLKGATFGEQQSTDLRNALEHKTVKDSPRSAKKLPKEDFTNELLRKQIAANTAFAHGKPDLGNTILSEIQDMYKSHPEFALSLSADLNSQEAAGIDEKAHPESSGEASPHNNESSMLLQTDLEFVCTYAEDFCHFVDHPGEGTYNSISDSLYCLTEHGYAPNPMHLAPTSDFTENPNLAYGCTAKLDHLANADFWQMQNFLAPPSTTLHDRVSDASKSHFGQTFLDPKT